MWNKRTELGPYTDIVYMYIHCKYINLHTETAPPVQEANIRTLFKITDLIDFGSHNGEITVETGFNKPECLLRHVWIKSSKST